MYNSITKINDLKPQQRLYHGKTVPPGISPKRNCTGTSEQMVTTVTYDGTTIV